MYNNNLDYKSAKKYLKKQSGSLREVLKTKI